MQLSGLRLERARASAQFTGGKFHNTGRVTAGLQRGSTGGVMREWLFERARRRPPGPVPVASPLAGWAAPADRRGLRVTWLGHSTLLLEVDGLRLLTDPVLGARLGPLSFAGPRRLHRAPVEVAELPELDAVLVSHDHYDHLCKTTMQELAARRVPVITSLGVGAYLEAYGVEPALISELDWWESVALGALRFTATPAQHFSGRLGLGRNGTLWSSWVIESDRHKLFFSGDTGLTDDLRIIAGRHGPFDLIALEIGAWHPAWGTIHLGPENALAAFGLLGGGTLLPVHWATFDLGLHPWAEPAETLFTLAGARGARVLTPMLGQPFEPARVDSATPWWRAVGAATAPELAPAL